MMDMIIKTFRYLWAQKWKGLFLVVFTFVFLFLLFPFKDLNDFVSGRVSALTGNKVYLQFEDMHINPITTGISLDGVLVETSGMDSINITSIAASPSFAALLRRQPGGKLVADGLFDGHAEVKLTPLEKLESGALKAKIDVNAENISLKKLRETMRLSIALTGSTDITANITADMSFKEQPDGEISIVIDNFEMPTTSVDTPMGSVNLPEMKFKKVDVKGKLAGGKFVIENAKIGNPSDELSGTLKGDIGISIDNTNGQATPRMIGGYNLNLDLVAKPAFVERAGFFLGFIDQFKQEEKGIIRYRLKLQASSLIAPPTMSPLN